MVSLLDFAFHRKTFSQFILNIIKFADTLAKFNGAQIHEGKESQASGTWLWQRGIK
jgi:hypothetical protein